MLLYITRLNFVSGVLIAKRVLESQDCYLIELDFLIVPRADFDSAEVPSISKALSGASVIDLKITTTEEDLIGMLCCRRESLLQIYCPNLMKYNDALEGQSLFQGLLPLDPGLTFLVTSLVLKWESMSDIVTGTAHCALAGYWSKKLGKCDFAAYQLCGILNLHLDEKTQRVLLLGKAITVMEGFGKQYVNSSKKGVKTDSSCDERKIPACHLIARAAHYCSSGPHGRSSGLPRVACVKNLIYFAGNKKEENKLLKRFANIRKKMEVRV
ncbi:unnamed protein product [Camellia sinensis]